MAAEVIQQLLNWLVLGSIYALLAIGFSLLFGVINVIHFSHGDVSLIGPFVALAIVPALGSAFGPGGSVSALLMSMLAAIFIIGILGVVIERIVIRPLRDAPAMMPLVATVALGIFLREAIRRFYPQGSNPQAFSMPFSAPAFSLGEVAVSWFSVIVLATTATLLAGLFFFLKKTPMGVRIRAVSQDREAARLMGVRSNRVFQSSFFIASASGAIAGLFYAGNVGATRFDFGILAGLMGFSAAVVGGLGSIFGAVVGGLLIAGAEVLAQALVPDGAAYRQVFAFMMVIVFLLFRPEGLLGKVVVEKV
ncbi:branched-chain amino acid ABC transporter permease [Noviherbaspirillum saxi]|uniref:Branched-chain amino acid ABC transporter permease n=1 Tax=Noviherbaspirillum saxi TaxID=2320863 RepID=A0A3A3FEN4_9BURK|nr:branched-chain amino acid ABC transporter permease [Noviherbaspirillum saxi]RJF91801.1 branched-chain amino acid ABC transporter permease [Noviherbaspirillum saxi]